MLHSCQKEILTVVKLGSLDASGVEQALYRANELQQAFFFKSDFYNNPLPLEERYRLANGGFDLCGAVKQALQRTSKFKTLPRPLLVLSDALFGDPDHPNDPEAFYFSSQEDDYDPQVTIISTQPFEELEGLSLESYLLMMLSAHILSTYANISYHDRRGCILDYMDEWVNDDNCMKSGVLCNECEIEIHKRIRRNQVSLERIAAAIRLFHRAIHKKYCFVVMPFRSTFDGVYETIRTALQKKGWQVRRSDEVVLPRLITDSILKEILTSDLVIADITGGNPNVAYEVGLTHALGNDLLLLTQDPLPFDLKNEQTIFYQQDRLEELIPAIHKGIGQG